MSNKYRRRRWTSLPQRVDSVLSPSHRVSESDVGHFVVVQSGSRVKSRGPAGKCCHLYQWLYNLSVSIMMPYNGRTQANPHIDSRWNECTITNRTKIEKSAFERERESKKHPAIKKRSLPNQHLIKTPRVTVQVCVRRHQLVYAISRMPTTRLSHQLENNMPRGRSNANTAHSICVCETRKQTVQCMERSQMRYSSLWAKSIWGAVRDVTPLAS